MNVSVSIGGPNADGKGNIPWAEHSFFVAAMLLGRAGIQASHAGCYSKL